MGCNASAPTKDQAKKDQTKKNNKPEPKPETQKKDAKTDNEKKKAKIDKKVIDSYLKLERNIRELEVRNILKNIQMKEEQLKALSTQQDELEKQHAELKKQTQKEKDDVVQLKHKSLENFFTGHKDDKEAMSKEQEEYVQALNKEEIVKKQRESTKKQLDQLNSELKKLKKEADSLAKCYKQQDDLLENVFGGSYGSTLEEKLEKEVDVLLDQQQRISISRFKWQNSQTMVTYAVGQLGYASQKWTEAGKIDASESQKKFITVTEARNNLIAASQNLTTAQNLLPTIQFPYCKPEEVRTLTQVTNNVYIDMLTPERHEESFKCINTTHQRSAALSQWFTSVISTIDRDLETVHKQLDMKTQELRSERLKLMRARAGVLKDQDFAPYEDVKLNYNDGGTAAIEADGNAHKGAGDINNPIPDKDLAPVPKREDLFGDISEIKKQHEKEIAELEKAQEVSKARMEQGLEEKLKARRRKMNETK